MRTEISDTAHPHCLQCGSGNIRIIATYHDYVNRARLAQDERNRILAYLEEHPDAAFTDFLSCGNCGLIRVNPAPSENALSDFYQDYYANTQYASKKQRKIERARKRLRRLRRFVPSGKFLDVGCNLGFAVEAARLEGFCATGIEIDADAIARAQTDFPANHFYATTVVNYTAPSCFDLVYCTEVIEHVADTVDFVKHLARLTKTGGYLYLTTPDAGHWRRPRNFVDWPEVKPLEHINWQTRRSLTQLLTVHGFAPPRFFLNMKPGLRLLAQRR